MSPNGGRFTYADFIKNLPSIHTWDGGITWNTGGFQREHFEQLETIFQALPKNATFLETGAGCSTIAMLLANEGQVISIAPNKELYSRIYAFCRAKHIATRRLKAYVDVSEWALPKIARKKKTFINFALIDGCHGWPNTFVDLYYVNFVLRQGGYLMIDDVQLHSVKEIARFLNDQPGFELALDIGKSLIYRKTTARQDFGEWNEQPYIVKRSNDYKSWSDPFATVV